ncbi:hypothetical protein JI59_21205 (plasmid) [Novosphingobium pentaromativorans US6-1]|nr:hypothetical protein JI59_21205 [Novosphingobium pentaromativorans US6-1]
MGCMFLTGIASSFANEDGPFKSVAMAVTIILALIAFGSIIMSSVRFLRLMRAPEKRAGNTNNFLNGMFSLWPKSAKYLDIRDNLDERPICEGLVEYRAVLRDYLSKKESGSLVLTKIGLTIAIVLISVPVITWIMILYQAFGTTEKLPNAWLLVVSSTATGGLGMAIALVILKHVNNEREYLIDIQDRILNYSELAVFFQSSDVPESIKLELLRSFLKSMHIRSKTISIGPQLSDGNIDGETKFLETFVSALKGASN